MSLRPVSLTVLLLLILALGAVQPALAMSTSESALPGISGYNLLAFDNVTVKNSSIQGGVAVGGDLAVQGGYSMTSGQPAVDLIVGGDLTWKSSGQLGNGRGRTVTSGAATLSKSVSHGDVQHVAEADLPLDFAELRTLFSEMSTYLGTLDGVSVKPTYGTLSLVATEPGLNVFYVDGSTLLNGVSNLTVVASAGQTVVINVTGGMDGRAVGYDNAGFSLAGGVKASNVLLNFYQAHDVILSGISISGSILAPSADIVFNNGRADGQVVAQSFTGSGTLSYSGFSGDIPALSQTANQGAVPEPSTFALTGLGLLGLAGFLRHRTTGAR